MGKKSVLTQEIVNSFPSWSRIRTDPDSNGQRVLNTFANEIEELENITARISSNNHLSTTNLDEIDQIYKVVLPSNFPFLEESSYTDISTYVPPDSISGELDTPDVSALEDAIGTGASGDLKTVSLVEDGDIKTFWEDSFPDSISLGDQVDISKAVSRTIDIVDLDDLDSFQVLEHPLKDNLNRGGGRFYFTLVAGYPYLRKEDQRILRSRIVISGETRKGTYESETIVFPWSSTVPSKKEWATITSIIAFDVNQKQTPIVKCSSRDTEGLNSYLSIEGDNSSQDDYLSLQNLRTSIERSKVDEFWGLTNTGVLQRIEYSTDNWRLLLKGQMTKIAAERWSLLDKDLNTLSITDIELVPFKNQFWAVDDTNLYLYSLDIENNENIESLKDPPDSPGIEIMLDSPDVIPGEKLNIAIFHKRLYKTVSLYSLSYLNSAGTRTEILPDTISSNNNRVLCSAELDISANGGYILEATVTYADGTTETAKKLVTVKSKTPLKTFPLKGGANSLGISGTPSSLFLDSDQKLWVKTEQKFNEIKTHKNLAIIDYKRKVIYLHENYKELTVNYPDPT